MVTFLGRGDFTIDRAIMLKVRKELREDPLITIVGRCNLATIDRLDLDHVRMPGQVQTEEESVSDCGSDWSNDDVKDVMQRFA